MLEKIKLVDLARIVIEAGKEILNVYHSDFEVESKDDQSPLTLADKHSHRVITSQLRELYPDIPILSEEGQDQPYAKRRNWDVFWLVDPLDGTKEFIKRNGEFTVNIALVDDRRPVLGFIHAPVLDTLYFARQGLGAYRLDHVQTIACKDDSLLIAHSEKLPSINGKKGEINVIASRSHLSPETEKFIARLNTEFDSVHTVSAGSSLKLCKVAEGSADIYPRFAPTMEWDTAAGQAIVEQAGGSVTLVDEEGNTTHDRLLYNRENLVNPWFVARRRL